MTYPNGVNVSGTWNAGRISGRCSIAQADGTSQDYECVQEKNRILRYPLPPPPTVTAEPEETDFWFPWSIVAPLGRWTGNWIVYLLGTVLLAFLLYLALGVACIVHGAWGEFLDWLSHMKERIEGGFRASPPANDRGGTFGASAPPNQTQSTNPAARPAQPRRNAPGRRTGGRNAQGFGHDGTIPRDLL